MIDIRDAALQKMAQRAGIITRDDGDEIRRRLDENLERLLDHLYPGWQHRARKAYLAPVSPRDLGSFQMELCGRKRGLWVRFSQAVGGGSVELISYFLTGKTECYAEAFREARSFLGRSDGKSHDVGRERRKRVSRRNAELDSADNGNRALDIWKTARPLLGTVGETYLRKRGIHLEALPEIHHALRWAPACPWGQGVRACVVALFTELQTGRPRAIHRIAITKTADKVDRWSLGPTGGCVVRLWPDDAVESALVIGEGIETTLAAATRISHRQTLLQPAWAAGCAGNLKLFPVLAGIGALTILVDHDANEAGQKAAAECGRRWFAEDRSVIRLVPREQGDFNDLVIESAA